jgi:hypothetical protein
MVATATDIGRDVSPDETKDDPSPKTMKVYLSPQGTGDLEGVLGLMARVYRLDTNGQSLLTRSAAFEMRFVAVMLTVIFLFDFAAWTLFWNMIFYGGHLGIGLKTPLAMILAGLIATMVVLYERGFMVSDMSQLFRSGGATIKLLGALVLRIAVIAVSAYVTAQPVEIVAFSGAIENRVHDESVLREAVGRLRDLRKSELEAKGLADSIQTREFKDAKEKLNNAQAENGKLRARLESSKQAESAAMGNLQAARAAYGASRNKAAAQRRISAAAGRLEEARRDVSNAQGALQAHDGTIAGATSDKESQQKKIEELQEQGKENVERVRDWLIQLKNEGRRQEDVAEKGTRQDHWTFRDQEYDFFQRQSVIDDLYYGRPPRWKDASEEDKQEIAGKFGFGETQEELERRIIEANTFAKSYKGVFMVAFVLPLLVMAYKLLFPKDLTNYYSNDMQGGKFALIKPGTTRQSSNGNY